MPADSGGNVLERCLYHLQEQGFNESESYAICLKPEKGLRSKYPKIEKWVHKAPSDKKDVKLDNIRPGKKWHQKNKKKSSVNFDDFVNDLEKLASDDPFRIMFIACIKAEEYRRAAIMNKQAGFFSNMMIKSLKIAQKVIKGLILKYPFKALLAYNTMNRLLKTIEEAV